MSGVGRYPDRARLGWWGLALALFGALWLAVSSVAGAVCLGVAAYYAARPIHRSFRHRVRFEGLAALCSLSVLALPMSAALAAVAGITAREVALASWLARRYEGVERFGRQFVVTLDAPTRLFSTREIDALGNAAETGMAFTGIVGTVAIHLFVACAIAFYLLRDDHRFVRWVSHRFGFGAGDHRRTDRSPPTETNRPTDPTRGNEPIPASDSVSGRGETVGTTTPLADGTGAGTTTHSRNRRLLGEYCRRVDRDLEGVFFGAAAGALVTAAVGVLAYGLLGSLAPPELAAPYLQLGLAVGVGGLVPAIGRKLVYCSAAVVLTSIALAGSLGTLWFVAVFLVTSLLVVELASDRVLRTYGVDPRQYGGLMALACVLGVLQVGW